MEDARWLFEAPFGSSRKDMRCSPLASLVGFVVWGEDMAWCLFSSACFLGDGLRWSWLLCGLCEASFLHRQLCWFCEFGGWGLRLRWCLSIAALWRSAVPLPFQAVSCPGGGSCSLRSSRRSSVPVLTRASLGGGFLCRKALSVVFSGDGGHGVSSGYVLDALVRLFI